MRLVELHYPSGEAFSVNPEKVLMVNKSDRGTARIFMDGGGPDDTGIILTETYQIACAMLED